MKRILIISDSLSLPRKEVEYIKTYPYLLKLENIDKKIDIVSIGMGGGRNR